MAFEYPYTCSTINDQIEVAKRELVAQIECILEDTSPLLPTYRCRELAEKYADRCYDALESAFENVRETNEKMRAAAESQIHDLECEVVYLKDDVDRLRRELEEYQ